MQKYKSERKSVPMRVREEMSDEEKYFETKRQRERERYCVWVHDRKRDNEKLCENHKR